MQKLRNLQEQFANHLQGLPTDPDIADSVKHHQLANLQRLQVYQNNYRLSLIAAMASVYPVIQKLVGEGFFNHIAHEYIKNHPSEHGNLHEYGGEFAEFIANFEAAKGFPYLPDMARFEWNYHLVFHDAEVKPFDLQRLEGIAEDDYGNIIFKLNPASRLIHSQYPLLAIWQANQSDEPPEISLKPEDHFFMIARRRYENVFQTLDSIEYQFLSMLSQGLSLGEISNALEHDYPNDQIDLNQLLIKNVSLHNIYDFKLSKAPTESAL